VDFDDSLELGTIDATLATYSLERIGLVGSLNLVTARILDGRTELDAQAAIESEPGVEGAPLAYLFEFTASAAEKLAGSVPPEEVPEVVGDLALSLFWPHYVMDTFAAHGLAEAIRGDALSDVRLAVVDGGFQRQNGDQRGDELESLLVDPNNFDMVSKVVLPIGSQVTIVEGAIPRVPDIVVGDIDVESNPIIHLPDWIFLDSEVFLFNNLHGLEVASLAVGAGRDLFLGTGRHVRLIPVRWPAWVPGEQIGVTHDSGVSIPMEFKSADYAAAALAFLADIPDANLKVLNMSWGSRVTDVEQRGRIDDTTLSALAKHEQQGRILVAGAGNDDSNADEFHPANLSVPRNPGGTGGGRLRNLMTVSGTALPTTTEVDEDDDVDEIFQAVGALPEFEGLRERRYQSSNSGNVVSVSAPAENVTVLNALSTSPFFGFTDGTSFSAPLVAGLAAEMFAVDPSARPSEVIDIIQATADDLVGATGAPGWDPVFGHGRINAWKALLALVNRADPERPKWLGIRFRSTVDTVRPDRLALGGTPVLDAITKRVPELDDAADDNARAVPFETATPTATASLFSFEAADLGATQADPTGTGQVALLEISTEDGTLAYQIPLRLEDVLDARPLGARVDDFVLTLEQQTEDHASLYGRVTAEGAPVAGATITYASSAGGEGMTTSDPDGYYTAYDVAADAPFEASAEKDSESTTVPDVLVTALQARQVNFELGETPPPGAFVIEAYNNRNGEFSSTEVPGFDPMQADIQLSGSASAPIITWGSDTPEGPKPNVSSVSVELQPSRLEIWGIEDVIWSGIVPPDYATNVIAPPVTYGDFSVPGTNPFPGVSNPAPALVPGDSYQVRLLWFSNPGFTRTAWLNFHVE
ncbi:MAG: S8 family serine peptidase, partial [Gemmatimonadota bacterium]|nr:S8 family serine peptidase [Gemmatimonadota bacterium]